MAAPTSDEIDALHRELEVEILHGSEARRKTLAQGFVHRLLVVERGLIIPTFNVRHDLPPEVEDGSETKVEHSAVSAGSTVKYDLLGEIAEKTQLTRRTCAAILTGISPGTFAKFKQNPEQFITEAARLINEQKARGTTPEAA